MSNPLVTVVKGPVNGVSIKTVPIDPVPLGGSVTVVVPWPLLTLALRTVVYGPVNTEEEEEEEEEEEDEGVEEDNMLELGVSVEIISKVLLPEGV